MCKVLQLTFTIAPLKSNRYPSITNDQYGRLLLVWSAIVKANSESMNYGGSQWIRMDGDGLPVTVRNAFTIRTDPVKDWHQIVIRNDRIAGQDQILASFDDQIWIFGRNLQRRFFSHGNYIKKKIFNEKKEHKTREIKIQLRLKEWDQSTVKKKRGKKVNWIKWMERAEAAEMSFEWDFLELTWFSRFRSNVISCGDGRMDCLLPVERQRSISCWWLMNERHIDLLSAFQLAFYRQVALILYKQLLNNNNSNNKSSSSRFEFDRFMTEPLKKNQSINQNSPVFFGVFNGAADRWRWLWSPRITFLSLMR